MSAVGEFDSSVRLLGTFLAVIAARPLRPPPLLELLFTIDTVTDLLDDFLGALAGGLLLAWWGARGGGTSRREPVRPAAT